jgi:hypothetical protein
MTDMVQNLARQQRLHISDLGAVVLFCVVGLTLSLVLAHYISLDPAMWI